MENNGFTFTSKEEKQSYLKYLINEYKKNNTKVFRETNRNLSRIIEEYEKNGIPWKIALAFGSIGLLALMLWPLLPLGLKIIGGIGWVELVWGATLGNIDGGYYGFIPYFFIYPCKLVQNIYNKTKQFIKYRKDIKRVKNYSIKVENDEDEKLEKDDKIDIFLDYVDNDYYIFDERKELIDNVENLKNNILLMEDQELRYKYMTSLCYLCNFLCRAGNLGIERQIKAFDYAKKMIIELDINVLDELNKKEPEEIIVQNSIGAR